LTRERPGFRFSVCLNNRAQHQPAPYFKSRASLAFEKGEAPRSK
jgi:hypothetical protein